MAYYKLLNAFVDTGLVVLFFWGVKPSTPVSKQRRCMAMLPFLLLFPIYLTAELYTGNVWDTVFRMILRVGVYCVYVHLAKQRNRACSLYLAILAWVVSTAGNNLILTPVLYDLRHQWLWFGTLIECLLYAVLFTVTGRLIPMNTITVISYTRIQVSVVAVLVQMYVKAALARLAISNRIYEADVLTSFPFLLQVLLLSALVFFERYMYSRAQEENIRISDVANRYRYEYAQVSAESAHTLRQIHHDTKNHLLAIQQMANDNAALNKYIQSLLSDLSGYETLVHTGNELLDGLLSSKLRTASLQDTALTIQVDFSAGGFVQEKDICAIFGNAVDNALEASAQVEDPELRSVLVKCGKVNDYLVVSVSNYYEGELLRVGTRLLSRKAGSGHGIGISSIQHAAEQYGGTVAIDTDSMHNFIITVCIPIPENQ